MTIEFSFLIFAIVLNVCLWFTTVYHYLIRRGTCDLCGRKLGDHLK